MLRALGSSKLQLEAQNFDNSLCIFHIYSINITLFISSNSCQPPIVQNRVGFIVRKIFCSQNLNHPVEEVWIFHLDWWFVCFHVFCHKLFLEFEICYSFCWKTLSTFDSSKMMHFDVNSSGYNLTFCSVHPQTISEWGKSICRSFIKHYIHQSNLNWYELSIF